MLGPIDPQIAGFPAARIVKARERNDCSRAGRFAPRPSARPLARGTAMYIGISPSKFDELVADGRMPGPVKIDNRMVWDIRRLVLAFDALSMEDRLSNSWAGV